MMECRDADEILETWRSGRRVKDLRTAAFLIAINKAVRSRMELGVFP